MASGERFMARALELAESARGRTAPNPCVGAVLVKDNRVAAEGCHQRAGGPHAEAACLENAREAGVDPTGAALYVTLEPCNHQGRTPPCTKALIEAGVAEVNVGCSDPNPSVAGGGGETLRQAGIRVTTGILEQQCRDLIHDFLTWTVKRRSYLILKLACTLDGRIAAAEGKPEPVTSPESKARVQVLRATVDAVLVGSGTLVADDPCLDCRLEDFPEDREQPLAVVAGTTLPDPDAPMTLLTRRAEKTVFLTGEEVASSDKAQALRTRGCRVYGLPALSGGGLDLSAGLGLLLMELGCHRVLCEGGGGLAGSLLRQGLVDEYVHFLAPRVLGDEAARPAFRGLTAPSMAQAKDFRIASMAPSGPDVELVLKPEEE